MPWQLVIGSLVHCFSNGSASEIDGMMPEWRVCFVKPDLSAKARNSHGVFVHGQYRPTMLTQYLLCSSPFSYSTIPSFKFSQTDCLFLHFVQRFPFRLLHPLYLSPRELVTTRECRIGPRKFFAAQKKKSFQWAPMMSRATQAEAQARRAFQKSSLRSHT